MNTMKKIFLTLALLAGFMVSAQVKIGDNVTSLNANSLLELQSTTKGVLFPRVALTGTANVAPLAAHVQGMTVYNTATTGDVTPGMYTNNGAAWVRLGATTTATSVVVNTSTAYTVLGTEDIILNNTSAATVFTLPVTTTIGKRIVISNKSGSNAVVTNVASGGVFWLGGGVITAPGNSNVYTYSGVNGWILESIGLN
jgi:hypothetical protein